MTTRQGRAKARRTPGQYPDPLGNRGGRAGKPWRVLNRGAEYNARAAKACADGVEDAGCWRGRGGQIASHPQQVHAPEARGWTAEMREGRRRRRRRGDEGERRDRKGAATVARKVVPNARRRAEGDMQINRKRKGNKTAVVGNLIPEELRDATAPPLCSHNDAR